MLSPFAPPPWFRVGRVPVVGRSGCAAPASVRWRAESTSQTPGTSRDLMPFLKNHHGGSREARVRVPCGPVALEAND